MVWCQNSQHHKLVQVEPSSTIFHPDWTKTSFGPINPSTTYYSKSVNSTSAAKAGVSMNLVWDGLDPTHIVLVERVGSNLVFLLG